MGTDSLYYIMDYSGHYYRTDKADQLVAVAGEQDATIFTFAQANSRICVGKKASFYCMVPIEETEEDMSGEVSDSNEIDDNSSALPVEEQEENNDDEYVSTIKELTYDEVTEPIEKNVASYDLSEMDWAEYLTHFTYLVEGLKDYREELSKKHSDIDQKICDILHYIELCETDDNEAADLIELLRVCRENRRDIKDELQRIEYFQTGFGTNANVTRAKQALKAWKQESINLENTKSCLKIVYSKTGGCKEMIYIEQLLIVQMQSKDTALNQHLMRRMVKNQWQKKEVTLHLMEKRMTGFHLQDSRWSFIEMPGSI